MAQTLNVLLALKRWIRVQVPKIEDGNNFGVSVQLDVAKGIGELTTPVASSLGVCVCVCVFVCVCVCVVLFSISLCVLFVGVDCAKRQMNEQ